MGDELSAVAHRHCCRPSLTCSATTCAGLCVMTEHSRTGVGGWGGADRHHRHHVLVHSKQCRMTGKMISSRISSPDSRSFQRATQPHQPHTNTQVPAPGGPLLMVSCRIRVPPYLNAFLSSCLMSARHALASAHTYGPPRMYSVQLRSYRHQCVHYMHEGIKSMSSLWVCRRGRAQRGCRDRRAEGLSVQSICLLE